MPNSLRNVAAKPSPMPGTPGTLSTESPVRARKSTTWSGRMPHSFSSAAASITLFLRRLSSRTWSLINWRASLSAVTMKTSSPALLAAAGQGRDHVVGLHPGLDDHGHPKPLEDAADDRDLRDQVDGHLLTVRLVLGVDLRAEDRARRRRRPPPGSRACGPCTRFNRSRKIPKTACVGCPAGPVISGIAWKTWKIREWRPGCRSSAVGRLDRRFLLRLGRRRPIIGFGNENEPCASKLIEAPQQESRRRRNPAGTMRRPADVTLAAPPQVCHSPRV